MPKILGMEPKTAMWVGGGIVAVFLVILFLRSRGSGEGVGAPTGAGPGFGEGAYSPSAPASGGAYGSAATPGGDAGNEFQRQLQELEVTGIRDALSQAKAMFDLQFGAAQQELAFRGQYGQQELAAHGAETEQYVAATRAVTDVIKSGKIKPECGKGESSYLDPNTKQWQCKSSGKSGVKAVGDAIGGAITDAISQYGPTAIGAAVSGGSVKKAVGAKAGVPQKKSNPGNSQQNPQYSGGTVILV